MKRTTKIVTEIIGISIAILSGLMIGAIYNGIITTVFTRNEDDYEARYYQ